MWVIQREMWMNFFCLDSSQSCHSLFNFSDEWTSSWVSLITVLPLMAALSVPLLPGKLLSAQASASNGKPSLSLHCLITFHSSPCFPPLSPHFTCIQPLSLSSSPLFLLAVPRHRNYHHSVLLYWNQGSEVSERHSWWNGAVVSHLAKGIWMSVRENIEQETHWATLVNRVFNFQWECAEQFSGKCYESGHVRRIMA